jgi:RsiW-degrading membrane proteinase PrsW (M82 family)
MQGHHTFYFLLYLLYDHTMTLTPILIVAFAIAILVPLFALIAMRALDLYGTGSFRTVLACFLWGIVAFLLAYWINTAMLNAKLVSEDTFRRYSAPILEELLKAGVLLYLVRRPNFTYFVDGAIYGFAAGIGFAVIENCDYILGNSGAAMGIAIARVLSTNLMHASTSGVIGIALGMSRFQRFSGRTLLLIVGFGLAMAIHVGFNNLVTRVNGVMLMVYAIAVGFTSTGTIAFAIKRGLSDQKKWIEETLGEADRVTGGEARVVNKLEDVQKILKPLVETFGKEKGEKIRDFLVLQAQLGIKRKTLEKLTDDNMREAVRKDMDGIRAKMDQARRDVGSYAMLYLRNIFPEDGSPVLNALQTAIDQRIASGGTGGPNPFALLGNKMTAAQPGTDPENPAKPTG